MCNYKPLVMVFLVTIVHTVIMLLFTLGMWMYFGDFYPSYRYKYTWFWSLISYLMELIIVIICCVALYKENIAKSVNVLCFTSLCLLAANWIALTVVSYPPMSKEEFKTYVFDYYREEGNVPLFMEFFQFNIGCCGIDDYRDYYKAFGTRVDDSVTPAIVVFDVPRSCCFKPMTKHRDCGKGIPLRYGNNEDLIASRLNSHTVGCYSKFSNIVYTNSNYQFRVFEGVYKNMPFFFIAESLVHLGIYIRYYRQSRNRIRIVYVNKGHKDGHEDELDIK